MGRRLYAGLVVFVGLLLTSPTFTAWLLRGFCWGCVYLQASTRIDSFKRFTVWSVERTIDYYLAHDIFEHETDVIPIPEIPAHKYSSRILEEYSRGFRYPVVMRGLLKNTTADRLWDVDYLERIIGNTTVYYRNCDQQTDDVVDQLVHYSKHHTDRALGYVPEQREFPRLTVTSNADAHEVAHKKDEDLTLRDSFTTFRDVIKNGGAAHLSDAMGDELLFMKYPWLLKDLEMGHLGNDLMKGYVQMRADRYTPLYIDLFITSRNETHRPITRFHNALFANVFMEIRGRKKWRLIAPEHAVLLKPVQHIGPLPMVVASATLLKPETDRLYKKVPRWETVLEEGDVLYNPPIWYHQVECQSDLCISVASREGQFLNMFAMDWSTIVVSLATQIAGWIYDMRLPRIKLLPMDFSPYMTP